MRQLENNLQPTWSLKAKYLLQFKRLKNATSQYDVGIISTWQFMQLTSYTTSGYISRHINWINKVYPNSEPEVEAAAAVQPIQEPQLPIAPQVSTCIFECKSSKYSTTYYYSLWSCMGLQQLHYIPSSTKKMPYNMSNGRSHFSKNFLRLNFSSSFEILNCSSNNTTQYDIKIN